MKDKIWLFAAILSISLLLLGIAQKSREFICIKKQGRFAIGIVSKIRGRETNTVEYAHFTFPVNQRQYTGPIMIPGKKENKEPINVGDKFLVIYCPERPGDNIIIPEYPLSKSITSLDGIQIDTTKIKFSILYF